MLFPAMACGQTKPNDMDDKKQIENLYRQMYQAMIAKDIAALDTMFLKKWNSGLFCLEVG